MVDTDHSRDLPGTIFAPPDVNELCFPHNTVVLLPRVKEAVNSDLNSTISCQGINFERSGHQLALHLSAKIVLQGIHDLRPAHHQAVFVMVKLSVIGPKRRLSFHVTAIDRIEELLVEPRDRLKDLI